MIDWEGDIGQTLQKATLRFCINVKIDSRSSQIHSLFTQEPSNRCFHRNGGKFDFSGCWSSKGLAGGRRGCSLHFFQSIIFPSNAYVVQFEAGWRDSSWSSTSASPTQVDTLLLVALHTFVLDSAFSPTFEEYLINARGMKKQDAIKKMKDVPVWYGIIDGAHRILVLFELSVEQPAKWSRFGFTGLVLKKPYRSSELRALARALNRCNWSEFIVQDSFADRPSIKSPFWGLLKLARSLQTCKLLSDTFESTRHRAFQPQPRRLNFHGLCPASCLRPLAPWPGSRIPI